ncbi:50S ribosomal protein P1 [Candidatus Micrarchaeota archaeon CG_4_10_14_0_2_um_filter_55_9]|nr:MAG: 50S ribosomal protein P1 [Candidatus Micrarchaeota archaeon CG1_02_55_41]PIO03043.1 MAG: 50S ribosomal protein P1 [Candidatus Micrarchaeota archaeon CG09_land_8_20_14_0_10_55_25]PIZ92119.1 MAG: 50S ribosomal protein P1 [Candidatus Micrarchaeota archaeon CG_4_10_14_0_2_um_filter_55_9]PJD01549.1 MAG: 50S ribosomal protein P1 [Candidatus Micrarchaeota archaeon CG10_big_fil_rev_8_21_14_0_10_54_18]
MRNVYAAMLLHSAGKPINEENVGKVLSAAGIQEEEAKIKVLCVALDGVNIDEAVEKAAVAAAPAAAAPAEGGKKEEKADEKSEEEKEAEAGAGLAALFG